jgi:hypothetical protein
MRGGGFRRVSSLVLWEFGVALSAFSGEEGGEEGEGGEKKIKF